LKDKNEGKLLFYSKISENFELKPLLNMYYIHIISNDGIFSQNEGVKYSNIPLIWSIGIAR